VYVVEAGRAKLREVEIGVRTRDAVEVLRGLAAGETVLTSNLLRVREGSPIAVVEGGG
jgi:membrane fusion protein (multidrug efflux system)